MAKVYDRLYWHFLIQVMEGFSFSNKVYKDISKCVEPLCFSIMMSGTYKCLFKSQRDLRQGDPLSSYFFILIEEILSRLLKKAFKEGWIGKFFHPRGTPLISHLLCADDLLIFVNRVRRKLKRILKTLDINKNWSGQSINKENLLNFCPKKITSSKRKGFFSW